MAVMSAMVCPHCETKMDCWANPELSNWGGTYQYVCFNDKCPYFVRGWLWMKDRFSVNASYRYRVDPQSGETGPLPVWSKDAMKSSIIQKEEQEPASAG